MAIFQSKSNQPENRFLEEQLYEQVFNELNNGQINRGLWAKAIADSEGNESRTKSLYMKYRAQSIRDEIYMAEEYKKEIIKLEKEEENKRKKQESIQYQRRLEKARLEREAAKYKPYQRVVWLFFSFTFLVFSVLLLAGFVFNLRNDPRIDDLFIIGCFTAFTLWCTMIFYKWAKEAR